MAVASVDADVLVLMLLEVLLLKLLLSLLLSVRGGGFLGYIIIYSSVAAVSFEVLLLVSFEVLLLPVRGGKGGFRLSTLSYIRPCVLFYHLSNQP